MYPLVGGKIGPGIFALPLLFAIQIVMNVGLAVTVSTFVMLVPDATNAMRYITRILFFVTPVIYPANLLPAGTAAILGFQPLFGLFVSYQNIFSGGMPNIGQVAVAIVWAVVLLVVGGYLFLRNERRFTMLL